VAPTPSSLKICRARRSVARAKAVRSALSPAPAAPASPGRRGSLGERDVRGPSGARDSHPGCRSPGATGEPVARRLG
jgi:hypothetical protein